jgi:hypothetical protein
VSGGKRLVVEKRVSSQHAGVVEKRARGQRAGEWVGLDGSSWRRSLGEPSDGIARDLTEAERSAMEAKGLDRGDWRYGSVWHRSCGVCGCRYGDGTCKCSSQLGVGEAGDRGKGEDVAEGPQVDVGRGKGDNDEGNEEDDVGDEGLEDGEVSEFAYSRMAYDLAALHQRIHDLQCELELDNGDWKGDIFDLLMRLQLKLKVDQQVFDKVDRGRKERLKERGAQEGLPQDTDTDSDGGHGVVAGDQEGGEEHEGMNRGDGGG